MLVPLICIYILVGKGYTVTRMLSVGKGREAVEKKNLLRSLVCGEKEGYKS